MAAGVTSEWEDLQVKHGNWIAREKEVTQAELNQQAQEKLANYDDLGKKNLDELDELEDDLDDEIFNEYRKKRLAELEAISKKPHFGSVFEISREEYIGHVTKAPLESFVVLHLYQTYVEECTLINSLFNDLAKKYPLVKFVKIVATRCIENFRDDDCPCIIIYKAGDVIQNAPRIHKKLKNLTLKGFERFFKQVGVIQTDEDDEEEEEEVSKLGAYLRGGIKGRSTNKNEDEDDDREFTNSELKRKY